MALFKARRGASPAAQVRVLGTPRLLRQLKRLQQESPRTIKSGLAKLTFDVRDALQAEVGSIFKFSGPNTKRFLASSYKAKYREKAGLFTAELFPLKKSAEILKRHVEQYRVTTAEKADLLKGGKMAVPAAVAGVQTIPRGASGKVPRGDRPGNLLKRDAKGRTKGFISADGRVIMKRGENGTATPAYTLLDESRNQEVFDPQRVAEATIERRAGAAFADAIRRAIIRAREQR